MQNVQKILLILLKYAPAPLPPPLAPLPGGCVACCFGAARRGGPSGVAPPGSRERSGVPGTPPPEDLPPPPDSERSGVPRSGVPWSGHPLTSGVPPSGVPKE